MIWLKYVSRALLPGWLLGATPTGGSPDQMASVVAADMAKWAKLIRERKIAVE